MGISKITIDNTTLIDLTSDTVRPEYLIKGQTAHDPDGRIITGTFVGKGAITRDSDGALILSKDGDVPSLESLLSDVLNNKITVYINHSITEIPDSMFRGNALWSHIKTFKAYGVTKLNNYSLGGIGAENIAFPNITTLNLGFNGNTNIKCLDFGSSLSTWGAQSTQNATNLNTIIFRRSSSLVSCGNVNVVIGTKFANGGTGGTIYIPKALYDHLNDNTSLDYIHATNWSTIYAYGTVTFAKIEGSKYETEYADGTPISTT